jgi:hypothetical protein
MVGFPFDSNLTYDDYNNPIYDRPISSQPLRKLIRDLFSTGVMPNPSTNLQVNAGTDGMTVVVQPGFAVIDGGLCMEESTRTLEVTAASTTYDRIDTVVLRWNENIDVRTADLYIKAGAPSDTPVRPELQRGESVYEIGLADVFVTRNVATITADKITDTRYESARCGVVSSVSEFDTTTLYQQIQADLEYFKEDEESEFATWSAEQRATFDTWFASIQDILDEDIAAYLLENKQDKTDNNLATVNKTIVGAINEVKTAVDNLDQTVGEVETAMEELSDDLTTIRTWNISASNWVDVTGQSSVPLYDYTISTDVFNANSRPIWMLEGANGIPTSAEEDEIATIKYAEFDTTGITLHMIDGHATTDLVLIVKGV